jgi:hypothetical protein
MFERSDLYADLYPRVFIETGSTSIATTNGRQIQLGTKTVQSGLSAVLQTGIALPTTLFTVNTSIVQSPIASFKIDYSIMLGSGYFRTGTLSIASAGGANTTLVVTGASGNGTIATLTFDPLLYVPFDVGSVISVNGVHPLEYNGTYYTVTACSTSSVSYESTAVDSYSHGGEIIQNNLNFNDDYTENSASQIILSASQLNTTVSIMYTSILATDAGNMTYSISYFNVV